MNSIRQKLFSFFLLSLIILGTKFIEAQNRSYHYTTANGLISNHIYYVMQDSKGYLWFGTYQGVSRFDGKEFKNFTLNDGLLNNDVFIIEEDYMGRIWFGTYTNELCYFYEDSIIPFKHNEQLKEELVGNSVKTSLHVMENETVYLGDAINGLLKIDSNGVISVLGNEKRNVFDFGDFFLTSQRKKLSKYKPVKQGFNVINFFNEEEYHKSFGEQLVVDENLVDVTGNLYLIRYGKDSLTMVHGNFFVTDYSDKMDYRLLKYRADDIYLDKKKRIWTGSIYNGAFAYSDPFLNNQEFHILSGNTITHIIEDFQGGYWFTTLDNGVFHYPSINKEIRNSNLPADKVRQIVQGPGEMLFVLFDNSEVWYVNDTITKIVSHFDERLRKESNHIFFDTDENTLYLKGEVIKKNKDGFKVKRIPFYRDSEPRSRSYKMFKNNGTVYDIRGRGVYEFSKNPQLVFGSELEYNRSQSQITFNDTTWLGTLNGIYFVFKDQFGKYDKIKLDKKVTAIGANSQMMAMAVEGEGIIIKRKKGGLEKIKNIDLHESLKVFDLEVDNEGYILIGTTIGLYYAFKENEAWKVKKLSPQQADIAGGIYSILSLKDKIYLGSDEGLVALDKKVLELDVVPPISYISLSKIKGNPVSIASGAELDHDQNSLEINFTCIDYSETDDRVYAWKIDRKGEEWYETENATLYLDRLAPGKYKILVKSYSVPKVWSETNSLEFIIKSPFWLTWWFLGTSILVFIGTIVLIIYLRGEKLRKKAETELRLLKEKNELEMRALRAQMNPHFIFNTLNAIQFLIQSKQNKKAQHFLVRFSQLLRRVTDTSQDRRITLKEELDILQTYIDLQNLRFKDKFEYNVEIPDDFRTEKILIPGLILQPFVENAIQHGLSKKEGRGKLDIHITQEDGLLKFSIIDDGIGRANSRKMKLDTISERRSVGMSNVSSRLDILNYENQESTSSVVVTDLYNDKREACGTRIDLVVKYELMHEKDSLSLFKDED